MCSLDFIQVKCAFEIIANLAWQKFHISISIVLFKWVKLPSGWVVPGSCVYIYFGNCFVNCWRGAVEADQFRVWSTWEGAPCQVGTRLVKLTSLSSKSTCNFCCIWSSGHSFDCCIPVSSLQYLPIGKLLVMGLIPIGELSENWSWEFFYKVG